MIVVESKRKKPETILKQYPDAILADVTSGAKDGLVKLSPFYPHGGIPVPFSEGYTATCVEATLRKKIDEYVAKSGVFKKNVLADLKYSMNDFLVEWKKQIPVVEAEELAKAEASPNNPESRITPDHITRLGANEVFVFGSNEQGLHYGGAAKAVYESFGAVMGIGNGLQGKSYAIPSMSGLGIMGEYVKEFCEFAKAHPEKRFLVTPIGCGIAGYREVDVAPLFADCVELPNVTLPASFWDVLGD